MKRVSVVLSGGLVSVSTLIWPQFVCNPHLKEMKSDFLYHIDLGTENCDLKEMFSDVKFVVLGGSTERMKQYAEFLVKELPHKMETGQTLCDISAGTDRYVLYKVGPVLTASHGMGVPSLSIILNEIFKLLHYAECTDVTMFRMGTSGGLGDPAGSVVVTESAVDGCLEPFLTLPILGKLKKFPTTLDKELIRELKACVREEDEFKTVSGKTMCTNGFYEGQGRLDGAFCDYTAVEKMEYLRSLREEQGVKNIEMEAVCFAAMCYRAKVKGAVVCVTILDRLEGDQITTPHSTLTEWTLRPQTIITRYIKSKLNFKPVSG